MVPHFTAASPCFHSAVLCFIPTLILSVVVLEGKTDGVRPEPDFYRTVIEPQYSRQVRY